MLKRFGIAAAAVFLIAAGPASGQDVSSGAAGAEAPRFLLAAADQPSGRVEVVPNTVPVLRRRVSLSVRQVPVAEVLNELGRRLDVMFSYDPTLSGLERRLTLRVDHLTLAAVLTEVLFETGLDVLIADHRHLALVPRAHAGRATGQGGTITGRVTTTKTGAPVASVEILLAGTKWHGMTDTAGWYRLTDVDAGTYTLTARRFGYAKQSRQVTVRSEHTDTVDLTLEPVATRLDELVSTATGRQRRLAVPNDITTIDADSVMQAAPIRSVSDLLDGRVTGLTAQRTSGAPGDPRRLRLRGATSALQNNDPIVIVDGARVYAQQSADRSANLAAQTRSIPFATPSPLDYIDPNSIETIEVIKGPSAATLYGPDAANGVIVITTKKGKAGPTRWTLRAAHGRTRMAGRYPDLLFRWGHSLYDPVNEFCPLNSPVTPCVGDSVLSFQMLNDPALTVLDQGHTTDLSLGASGGTQAITYSITGSFSDALGLVKLPDYEAGRYQAIEGTSPPDWMRRPEHFKQWGATSNFSARVGAATVQLTSHLSRSQQQRSTLEQQLSDLMSTFLDRGSGVYYRGETVGVDATSFGGSSSYNLAAYRTRVVDIPTQFTNSVNANWPAHRWLTLNANASLDVQQRADELLIPRSRDSLYREGTFFTGELDVGTGTVLTSTVNAVAVATAPLGHGLTFRFASGVNYIGTSVRDEAIETYCLPYGSMDFGASCGNPAVPRRTARDDATFGWYLAPTLTSPRFAIDLGLRLDGGSSYGSHVSGFKLPTFPKLGFSYLLSDEPWFPFRDLFQTFRVRASYGRAGTQPSPEQRLRLYNTAGSVPGIGDYVTLQTLGNTELKPERTAEFEGGVDADLLERISLSITGYRKTKHDMLVNASVPPSVYGGGPIVRNIGVVRNTGLGLSVDAQLVRSSALTWNTLLTLSRMRSKVLRLGPGVLPFYTDANIYAGGGTRVAAGYPLFGRWSTPILGYADANGDGVLQPSEILLGDTAVYVGQQDPDYEITLQPSVLLWRGALTVTGRLSRIAGLAQTNRVAQYIAPFTRGTNDPTAPLAEQLATGVVGRNIEFNWIQTISTTRLQDLSVSYTIPANVARRLGAQHLSIAVQGSNLGLWTNYRGLDPNVNAFPTGNSVTDTGVLPEPRSWRVQIDATY